MISVIIPTMWKCKNFKTGKTLNELSQHEFIGEIILIDNAEKTEFNIEIPKLIHIKEGKNTYVNAAWNKGVRLAKYDKLLILNDDVETEWGVIDLVYDFITENVGVIGAGVSCWQYNGGIPQIEKTSFRTNCYGCLMFIHKKSYIQIPEQLKIHYGDDWLFTKSGKPNYEIVNWKMGGESEQTSGLSEFNQIKIDDANTYNSLK